MDENTGKHLGFFKFVDSFNKNDCPVCKRNDEVSYSYVDNLLYENVNDNLVRRELQKNIGFCKEHSHLLLKIRDPLGIAIIYDSLLNDFLEIVNSDAYKKYLKRNNCPICNLIEIQTNQSIKILLDYFNDQEFREKFEQTSGLCAYHLIKLLQSSDKREQKKYYLTFHQNKIKDLKKHLSELIRKNNYRFTNEKIFDEEAVSWVKALKFLNNYI